jgi:hypothetical protein
MTNAELSPRSGLPVALALLMLVATGCTTQTYETSPPEIRFDKRELKQIAAYKIYRDGKQIGTLESFRLEDGDNDDANDRHEMIVLDSDGQRLGYITDDERAYRFKAHGEPEIVGHSSSLPSNVLSIFGWTDGKLDLEKMVVQD